MNFEEEPYVRVYTRKTITTRRLGFVGRALLRELMCEADRAGIIEVGSGDLVEDRKSTRLNSSHSDRSRMPSSA